MNNLNASIVDQRLIGIVTDHADLLPSSSDPVKQKSSAFVLLCIASVLDISLQEASELLTDGGNDIGVDGLHVSEVDDREFTVTLFQAKYKSDLSGGASFPENEIRKTLNLLGVLFDPSVKLEMNKRIKPGIENIRSLVRDGYIPLVRVVLCNNGIKWNPLAQSWIDQSGINKNQVQWIHWNHDSIFSVLQSRRAVNETLNLQGKAIVEEFNFRRVLVGKVRVSEIADLFDRHDDLLLERNIRRYLGLHSNRVNQAIHRTLVDSENRNNFYFLNNGVTMICRKFAYNALQGGDYILRLEDLQIINGGQTCKTIQQTLSSRDLLDSYENVFVLVRIYELSQSDEEFVGDITYATNSQNPVDLRDLRSNDSIQRQLEIGMKDLGWNYKRQRDDSYIAPQTVTSAAVAEAVLATWRVLPHQARFGRKEHFGILYEEIFTGLNAAQAILAVIVFRYVESQRKREEKTVDADFIPYASHYIAMLMSIFIRRKTGEEGILNVNELTHANFSQLCERFDREKEKMYEVAIRLITTALTNLYGERRISLQQLSATFRRGDLLEYLEPISAGSTTSGSSELSV